MDFSELGINDLSGIGYQCGCGKHHSFPCRILLSYFSAFAAVPDIFPAGRILFLWNGECMLRYGERLRSVTERKQCVHVVVNSGDGGNLFALYDDIVGAIVMGDKETYSVARAYATLRRIPLIAVASGMNLDGIFNPSVRFRTAAGELKLHAALPDVLFADRNVLRTDESGTAAAFLRIFATRLDVLDTEFQSEMGRKPCENMQKLHSGIAAYKRKEEEEYIDGLFGAVLCAVFCEREQGRCGSAEIVASLMMEKGMEEYPARYWSTKTVLAVYRAYLERKSVCGYPITDYAARVRRAATLTPYSEREILQKMRIPTATQQRAREDKYLAMQDRYLSRLQVLESEFAEAEKMAYRLGGEVPYIAPDALRMAFSVLPELAPHTALPAVLRDAGCWLL